MLGERKLITGRYYNAIYYAAAIVAVVTEGIDWAAYIGGTSGGMSEEETVEYVRDYGCKLSESDARHYFDIDLPYRS